jgi:hypothetical protein
VNCVYIYIKLYSLTKRKVVAHSNNRPRVPLDSKPRTTALARANSFPDLTGALMTGNNENYIYCVRQMVMAEKQQMKLQ